MNLLAPNGSRLKVRHIPGSPHLALIFLHEGPGSASLWAQRRLDWLQAPCAVTGRAGVVYSRRNYGLV